MAETDERKPHPPPAASPPPGRRIASAGEQRPRPVPVSPGARSATTGSSLSRAPGAGKMTSLMREHQSQLVGGQPAFKNALAKVPVPDKLFEGMRVIKIGPKGETSRAFLSISDDRFTLYVTSSKVGHKKGSGGSPGGSLLKPLLLKARSLGSSGSAGGNDEDSMVGGGGDLGVEVAVDVGSIDRLQTGQNTLKFERARQRNDKLKHTGSPGKQCIPIVSSRSFSIIFRGAKTLDLMAEEGECREEIIYVLDSILKAYQEAKLKVGNDVLLLRYIWIDVDKDKSNTINASELGKVLDRINFLLKKSELDSCYQKFGKTIGMDRNERKKGLTFEQCVTFLHKIKRDTWQIKPVHQLFFDLFGQFMNNLKQRERVSAKSFLTKFLRKKQGDVDATLEDVQRLFVRLNQLEIAEVASQKSELDKQNYIDKDRFEAYLVSRENDIFDPVKERFDERNMSKPLPEYWINSSHNTYLTGNQYSSYSSVEMYMKALYRGCRCVELDIWDGQRDAIEFSPIPVVYHGRTMTTKIPFHDIIHGINVFLKFNPDSYPIILSLENHCSIPYQVVMADQLQTILGDRLYIPSEASLRGELPSPQSLRGMVVLKGRRPEGGEDYESDDETDYAASNYGEFDESFDTLAGVRLEEHKKTARSVAIAPELARLTLFHGTKFRRWEGSFDMPTFHMHSFSESRVRTLCKQHQGRSWTVYNQNHMSRVYPSGRRIDSSNFNPMLSWSTGSQMVALNFQTPSPSLRINDGRFRENGGCGYVLKPSTLMMKDDVFNVARANLSVRILSGSCLPKPKGAKTGDIIDPYVKVTLFDCSEGRDLCTTQTTNVVENNGFFPIWNQEKFTFAVENASVAILQLSVWDKDVGREDDFIASASIPISCLRQGIRSVQLFDANNTTSGAFDFASLLVEVKMKQALAEV